uniref:Uncharacterized protein n=1 Tax=Coccidioides posadasii RMSCC 3488 TaxID=454284 RepID=A0A0J6FLF2_COCPO|nr:hypothetical protein CPAG_07460 [Coccidioides posadasii RMSCC 3488]
MRQTGIMQTKCIVWRMKLGITCLLKIDNLNYHKHMAAHLIAKARRLGLSVPAIDPERDYHNLESLRCSSRPRANSMQAFLSNMELPFTMELAFEGDHNPHACK